MVAAGTPLIEAGQTGSDAVGVFPSAARVQDLRHALATLDVQAALVCTPSSEEGVRSGQSILDDPALPATCRERSIRLLTLEPAPGSLAEVAGASSATAAPQPEMLPLLVRSGVFASLRDVLDALGKVHCVSLSFRGALGEGTAAARLFDAMALVHALLGQPDTIDCGVIPPGAAQGVHPTPPEALRNLRGHVTANLRFSSAQTASVTVSDRAGAWFRGVTILAQEGCVRLTDEGFQTSRPDGSAFEISDAAPGKRGKGTSPRARKPAKASDESSIGAAVLAEQLNKALDPGRPAQPPLEVAPILAMCEAGLLSARTGQNESPSTVLRMNALA